MRRPRRKNAIATATLAFTAACMVIAAPQRAEYASAQAADRKAGEERTVAGVTFVWCPPGTYTRGLQTPLLQLQERFSVAREEWYADAKPAHKVTLTKGFWISKTEVTRAQWHEIMATSPWETGEEKSKAPHPQRPATHIRWDDARRFCEKLSENANIEARLPTDAEWEYACRAGADSLYSFGDDHSLMNEYGWHWGNTVREDDNFPHPVAQKQANAWGLHDTHGNVWEWCQDWYTPYQGGPQEDPLQAAPSVTRVIRGGSYMDWSLFHISAMRAGAAPEAELDSIGFRVCLDE